MKVTIDRNADALYLNLEDSKADRTEEIVPGILLDYNANGNGKDVGIEMLHLSKRANPMDLNRLQFETLETSQTFGNKAADPRRSPGREDRVSGRPLSS